MAESRALAQLAELVGDTLHKRSLMVATAESCTAGLVSAAITDISGASAWFERGFVTYSNEAKSQMLGVPATLIREHGAVSEPVAHAMAEGAVLNSRAQVALAVTGVAGPTGGTPDKPVGMVCFGWSNRLQTRGKPATSRATASRSGCRPPSTRCAACSTSSTPRKARALRAA
uniref:Putative competence-damage protein (CinA) n=1 Tax=blood disease bacterium R229 TaxID=741978 RepID=G2ZRS6_9RALS|nr:putative competence-damage protein (cinA) [blood disease bacterium R229]